MVSVIEPELVFVKKVEARAPAPAAPKRSASRKKPSSAPLPLPVVETSPSTGLSPTLSRGERELVVGTATVSTSGSDGDGPIGPPAPRVGVTRGASVASLPQVDYPRAARENDIEGVVRVRVTVDETGRVLSAEILESPGYGLGETARNALLRAIFNPALHDGQPVRSTFEYVYRFELRD